MSLPVALVTGANSGLGLALAVKLAKNHLVFAGMRALSKKDALVEAATQAAVSENLRPLELDVNSDASVDALGPVLKEAGRVDVLVNNAGYSQAGSVEFISISDGGDERELSTLRPPGAWVGARRERAGEAQMETNLFGVIRCQKACLPFMRAQKSGKIINISSVGGVYGQPFNDIYCASKFALEGMIESQAPVFRTFGVYVSCVQPGAIKSSFFQNAQRPDPSKLPAEYAQPLQSTLEAYRTSASSGQTPEEVADVIIQQIVEAAEPPVRVQTNPSIQFVFEQQCGKNVAGDVAFATSKVGSLRWGFQMRILRYLRLASRLELLKPVLVVPASRGKRHLHNAARKDEVLAAKGALSKSKAILNSKDKVAQHTALHIAAHEGSLSVAQLLVDQKAQTHTDERSDTPLHLAAYMGQAAHVRIAQILLTKRAAVDTRGDAGKTALHLAARRGQVEAVQLLTGSGAQVATTDQEGDLALHEAAREGRVPVVQELLRVRSPVDAVNRMGKTALHVACCWGQDAVVEALLQQAASIHAADLCGNSALHEGARVGKRFLAERLVACRAPLDARNRDQRTPLHLAAAAGNYDYASALMQYGASPDAPDAAGDSPVHLAAFYGRAGVLDIMFQLRVLSLTLNKEGRSAVHRAVQGGRSSTLKLLLEAGGRPALPADTPDNRGETPLHLSTALGDGHEAVETLVRSAAASLEARRSDGMVPLLLAAMQGKARTVEILLRSKAQLDTSDSSGNTALHLASERGYLGVVQSLLARQASPNARNSRNETPFQVAGTRGFVELARAMNAFVSAEPQMQVTQPSPLAFAQTLPSPIQTMPNMFGTAGMSLGAASPSSSPAARARSLPPPKSGKEPLMALLRRGQAASPAASMWGPLRGRGRAERLASDG
ncbi:unnamed protein product [Effrenium voratum]|nr:unnamed protein product [Effrenium voratum]